MASSVATTATPRPRANGEIKRRMLKLDLPKGESDEAMAEIGGCLDTARRTVGWTVDQLAAELGKDPKQVARWMRGQERTQVDAVFAVTELREPFVIALARLAAMHVEETVTIRRVV